MKISKFSVKTNSLIPFERKDFIKVVEVLSIRADKEADNQEDVVDMTHTKVRSIIHLAEVAGSLIDILEKQNTLL